MKSITAQTFVEIFSWNREHFGGKRHVLMKSRVKTNELRGIAVFQKSLREGQFGGQMFGIIGAKAVEFFEQYIKSDSIFASSTKEFLTSLYIKQGNFQKANELINTILTDPNAPPSIRSRVEQVSALIKVQNK